MDFGDEPDPTPPYRDLEQVEEDDDYFLTRRQKLRQAKNNPEWKGTFLQQSHHPHQQHQPFYLTFVDKIQCSFSSGSDENFSDLNSQFSAEQSGNKCNESTTKSTATFSLSPTENSEKVEKSGELNSDNFNQFAIQLNTKELLKIDQQPTQCNYQPDTYPKPSPYQYLKTQSFDKSVYLKPGKSRYEIKVESLGGHIYLKYKEKEIQATEINFHSIFEQFLKKKILLPQLKLDEIPPKYWKGCSELFVTFLNDRYGAHFKTVFEQFNKNLYYKSSMQNSNYFDFSLLKFNYSKTQFLIEAIRRKIECFRLIEDVEEHSVEEEELKIENLYFMMAFEKAETFCTERIKANDTTFKELKQGLIKDRSWWIHNYFPTVDI